MGDSPKRTTKVRKSQRGMRFRPVTLVFRLFSSTVKMSKEHSLVMDAFALRQFNNPSYAGSQIFFDPVEFEAKVNEAYEGGLPLVDGYAPFCKHIFVPNFCGAKCGYVPLSDEIVPLVRSGYEARTPQELPVLTQWVDAKDITAPVATHLDVILYSREQINNENTAMGRPISDSTAPWGIISIKTQMCGHELPMQPITMMRNALGKEEGGSGVKLDKVEYLNSVMFWSKHVPIK